MDSDLDFSPKNYAITIESAKNKPLEKYKALVIENDSDQMRNWINRFNRLGVDVLAATNLEDAFSKLNQAGESSIDLVVFNRRCLTLNQKPVSLKKMAKQLARYPNLFFLAYPALKKKLELDGASIELLDFDLPLSNKDFNQIVSVIKSHISKSNSKLISEDPLTKLLSPFLFFRSNIMRQGLALLPKIAKTPYNVLITGQTGTGKEMVARAIHGLSASWKNTFVSLNCGAIPETLIESELFGHEKGSFTGATQLRIGKFEEAHEGTLFLDEIGEMPLFMQIKLLKAIEDKKITRLGSNKEIQVAPRLIAATNIDLEKAVKQGAFREDLYYRLNVLYIRLPILAKRTDDIPLLAWSFLSETFASLNYAKPYPILTNDALNFLQKQPWPGNVRELKNFMIRLASTLPYDTKKIDALHIKSLISPPLDIDDNSSIRSVQSKIDSFNLKDNSDGIFIPYGTSIKKAKFMIIDYVLKRNANKLEPASQILGLSVRHLSRLKTKKNKK